MKEIELTQGKFAMVDDEDYEKLSNHEWCAALVRHVWYAHRRIGRTTISMHRVVMGLGNEEVQVDHIDGNGLNNQKSNLRICNYSENNWNSRKRLDNTSGFKGVNWHIRLKKWCARIQVNGKRKNLGYFDTAEEASYAYDSASREYHGEFSRNNSDLQRG